MDNKEDLISTLETKGSIVMHGYRVMKQINKAGQNNGLNLTRISYRVYDELGEVCGEIPAFNSSNKEYNRNMLVRSLGDIIVRQRGMEHLIWDNINLVEMNLKHSPEMQKKIALIIKTAYTFIGDYFDLADMKDFQKIVQETNSLIGIYNNGHLSSYDIFKLDFDDPSANMLYDAVCRYFKSLNDRAKKTSNIQGTKANP